MSQFSTENPMKITEIDQFLAENSYISGQDKPNEQDIRIWREFSTKLPINQQNHQNIFAWYGWLNMFNPEYLASISKGDGGKKASKPVTNDDDFDPFAEVEETAEQKQADLQKKEENRKKQEEKKNQGGKVKKEKAAQTQFVFEVKVHEYDVENVEEADKKLKDLAQKIYQTIQMDGLNWNPNPNLVTVAYGVKKLVLSCIIDDDKVTSTEDITGVIEAWEDEVQSVDTLAMQKV